jgi:glyoxylase-like metal-dependent hydrolase (beta-lactamase superfamily II)
VGATRSVREALAHQVPQAPVIALHKADEPLYQELRKQGRFFGMELEDPLPVDHYLRDQEELRIGDLKLSVIHTPGHSPGSVCFRLHEDSSARSTETLFSGDTLFRGSVGRTDLWGGDQDALFRNIRGKILTLDGDTRVCPGHGLETTIALEKQQNPFLK